MSIKTTYIFQQKSSWMIGIQQPLYFKEQSPSCVSKALSLSSIGKRLAWETTEKHVKRFNLKYIMNIASRIFAEIEVICFTGLLIYLT